MHSCVWDDKYIFMIFLKIIIIIIPDEMFYSRLSFTALMFWK